MTDAPTSAIHGAGGGGPTLRMIDVAGTVLSMSVRNADAGRPLLLIRGLGGATDRWDPLHRHMEDRTTIAFDVPGMGLSPAVRPGRRMGWYADLAAGVADAAGEAAVDVLGVSWGGALAQELAHRHPDGIRRVVLVATSAGLAAVPSVLGLADATTRGFARDLATRLQAARRSGADPRGVATVTGFIGQAAAMTGWTSIGWLGRVAQPALVVAGARDRIIPAVNARILAAALPDARLHLVPDAGHEVLSSHATEVFGAIRAFLDAPRGHADR